MRQFISIFIIAILCGGIISCSNVKNKRMSAGTIDKELQTIRDSKQLSEEESRLFTSYVVRSKVGPIFGGTNLSLDKTVSEMINDQRKFEEERDLRDAREKAMAEQAAMEESLLMDQLRKSIDVALFNKGFSPSNYEIHQYEDRITLGFVFKNLTVKDIRGFMGFAVFNDIFDTQIQKVRIAYDKEIPAGQTVKWDAEIKYNQFIDADKKFANTELKNVKLVWMPEKVLFSDGNTIGK